MSDQAFPDSIQPLDVAVVDQDLLWRVEMMNAVRPLYADDFADVASVPNRVRAADATLILLGRNLIASTPTELLELRLACPHISIVAVASAIVPEAGLVGVDLVLPADITDEHLVAAAVEFAGKRRHHQPDPVVAEGFETDPETVVTDARLILVTAAKGGVGRSTVALNLAAALAQQGVGQHVALVETDPVYGDIGLMLGLPGPGLRTSLALTSLTDQTVLAKCTFPVGENGLDVVLPPQPADPWTALTAEEIAVLVGAVAIDHDWIVVDVSPHLLRDTQLAALADLIYLVAPTDLPGLKNATILTAALRLQILHDHILELVLVDRDGRSRAAQAVAEAAGVPVAAAVPHDRNASASIEHQRPLIELHPHGAASRALRGLAERSFRALGVPKTGSR